MSNLIIVKLATIAAQFVFINSAIAQMQYAGTINYEYKERIDMSTNISPLGDDLFGDSTSYENGATTFAVTDVKAKTNVRIPVQLGRSLEGTEGEGFGKKYDLTPDIFGARWDAEVPYIEGDHLVQDGWLASGGRCSGGNFSLGSTNVSVMIVPGHNFSFGNDIKIPGYGKERLLALRPDGTRPSDGATYVGTTKSNWKVSCQATIKNGPGEGFIVKLPDGAKYYFDWLASADTGYITTERGNLYLTEMRLYATKAVDRFGGTVEYTYDVSHPHKIKQIKSSDGAIITVIYNPDNGKIASVSTGGRTWLYTHTPASASFSRAYDTLLNVILPDASKWTYGTLPSMESTSAYPRFDTRCELITGPFSSDQDPGLNASNFRITHPSGAVGDFSFRLLMFGYNRTPGQCSIISSYRPKAYLSSALYYKSISGSGVPQKTWSIKYYPSWSYEYECQGCPTTARTVISQNNGKTTTRVFGNDYSSNAGQLLSKTTTGLEFRLLSIINT
jgi:hypothetical protein